MSGGHQLPISHCETQRVSGITFEVFKSHQVKQHAVVEVREPVGFVNNQPVPHGLSDLRLGSTDRRFTCETCNMPHPDCPGHFGYIELAEAFFNIGLFDVTLQALRCVCKSCGALLSDPRQHPHWEEVKGLTGRARLSAIAHMCNKQKCGTRAAAADGDDDAPADDAGLGRGCGQEQPKLRKPAGFYPKLLLENTADQSTWSGEHVFRVLDKISDEDARLMGFDPDRCHPRDLLVKVLPVPPPAVRPSVSFGASASENELSHKLAAIIKANQKMTRELINDAGTESINEIRETLQEHIATYVSNKSTFYKPATLSKTPFKSISERLKGKYGRIRGNLMGKRVDFSARTVITGDPNIDVDEVGVPYSVAMTLTFPERVSAVNRKRLEELVHRTKYPSANYIIHRNGQERALDRLNAEKRQKIRLEIGDVVERHVLNGDVVLFNRQPTLHRMSMMGHRARVLPFSTFRLNLSCTTPYNADFDGDEMNLHVAQSLLTKAELIEMMMVPKNFVSPGKSQPCMGIVQDSLLGCYRITQKETFLDKFFMQNLVMWLDRWELPVPAIVKPEPLWTGKQVFSMLLPEVTHSTGDKPFPDDDSTLRIRRGELIMGPIKKGVVGAAPGSLIHVIANEKGSDEVAKFINFVQRTTAYFLYNTSFSVGVQDTVADKDTISTIKKIIVKTSMEVRRVAAKANNGELKRKTGQTLLGSFEMDVNAALNQCRNDAASTALKGVKRTNNFRQMIEAGSKGSDLNICQIAIMVGQQNVNGKRIPFGFRRRTLPHFIQDDYGETSRGMVRRGYLDGLTPPEFVFHTMGGREGLIDTAVKTADTGYLQRKLVKALEDNHAHYDGTVRNAQGHMLQLVYGEDGLEGSKIEQNQLFRLPFHDNAEMRKLYRFEYGDDGTFTDEVGGDYMPPKTKQLLRSNADCYRVLQGEFEQIMSDRDHARRVLDIESEKLQICLPVNLARLVSNAQTNFECGRGSQKSELDPTYIVEQVSKLQSDIKQFFASHHRAPHGAINNVQCQARIDSALTLFFIHLRSTLASKRVIEEFRLSDQAFKFLLGEIRLKYLQSLVPAGEMIGPIAAQSCGEPATQMTLNTFHNAGISSKNVTLGVPRLVELLGVSRNQKNSSMLIEMVASRQSRSECEKAAHLVEYASLETITRRIEILYDPKPNETIVEEDRQFVELEWDLELCTEEDYQRRTAMLGTMSPWVVRLELDREVVTDKSIALPLVKDRIEKASQEDREGDEKESPYFIEYPRKVGDKPVIRLRHIQRNFTANKTDEVDWLKEEIPRLLSRVHLSGIKGVRKVLTTEVKHFPVDPVTGGMRMEKKWCLDTEGTALRQVWGNVRDENGESIVDFRKTASNNIPEIYRTLGIEAARIKFFLEMRAAYLNYGVFINYRHYSVLIDTMTHRGYLMAVSRTGINRTDVGPMMTSSFEETVKVLMEAAAFGVHDTCRGVSASIMLGNQVKVGTGVFDLILDTGALAQATAQERAVEADSRDPNVYHGQSSMLLRTPAAEGRSAVEPFSQPIRSVDSVAAFGQPSPMDPGSVAYLQSEAPGDESRGQASIAGYEPSAMGFGGGSVRSGASAAAASAFAPESNYSASAYDPNAFASTAGGLNLATPGAQSAAFGFESDLYSADAFGGASATASAGAYQPPAAEDRFGDMPPPPVSSSRVMSSATRVTESALSSSAYNSSTYNPGDEVETMHQPEDRV